MGAQTDIYTEAALSGKTFQSTKHIATKAHVAVWQRRKDNGVWEQLSATDFELINNFCVLEDTVNTALYDSIEIRVADTPDELATSVSDISIVASISDKVTTVADSISNVNNVGNSIDNVNTVSSNLSNINIISNDIANVNSVADIIVPNMAEVLQADTNAAIATQKASEASISASIATTKATEASDSANNALSSEVEAENQAQIATAKAGIATTKANEASSSASSSASSASSSASSATTATTKASEASSSATVATTKASEASASATAAANSAASIVSDELTSATNAANAQSAANTAEAKALEATQAASSALTYKGQTEVYRNEALSAKEQAQAIADGMVSELPSGTINDATEAPNTAWSSEKIASEFRNYVPLPTNDIYGIGTPGEIGFGVSCLTALEIPSGFTISAGYYMKGASDYARLYDSHGSHMTAIRKHYFKIVGNTIHFSDTQESGYVLPRMFINAGQEVPFIIIDIHTCGNENGVFVSKPMLDPCSTNSAHNPISSLSNTPPNRYGGLYSAVKTRGSNYFLTPRWVYAHLALMAKAHGEAATSTTACAFIDVNPKMPKGNLINALRDVNDAGVTFTSSGYSNCALTGSGVPFAKTTHNGQECGIADLTGNMWEVASGFIRYDSLGFLVLKESVDIRSISDESTTQGSGGAYDSDLYDVVDISDLIAPTETGSSVYFGNGANSVFEMETDRTLDAYKRTALGIPLATGVSGSGTTEFGNDYLYRYLRNEMACIVGGYWGDSSNAGPFACTLATYRPDSFSTVGGRASYLV